jgi:hypothetical protein
MYRWLFVTIMILGPAVAAEAQFVAPGGAIPAVANLPGENDTFWRSDVTILNLNSSDIQVSEAIDIAGNGQITVTNVMSSLFSQSNKKGALYVYSLDASPIVLSSRTYTPAPQGGTFGLDVSGVLVAETAWVAGIRDDASFRTSVGIFVPAGPSQGQEVAFTVTVYDDAGAQVAAAPLSFEQAGMKQVDMDYLGLEDPLPGGWVEFRCHDPFALWYAYATVTDNGSGDGVFHPALTRQSSIP